MRGSRQSKDWKVMRMSWFKDPEVPTVRACRDINLHFAERVLNHVVTRLNSSTAATKLRGLLDC